MKWHRAAATLLLLSSSCAQSPPSGQVVARVDGIEITRRDVLIELMASGAPADVDTNTAQPALLDRIIVRKLFAEEARRQAVDRSPEFLGQERRSRELILGEQLAQRVVGRLPPPPPAEVARFIAANRVRFDHRQMFRIDRIILATRRDVATMHLSSNDLIADWLRQQGAAFERVLVDVDSMTLTPVQEARLEAAHGHPFPAGTGDAASIDQVIATVPQPTTAAQRADVATVLLRDMAARQAIDMMTARLRGAAQIDYAPRRQPSQGAQDKPGRP